MDENWIDQKIDYIKSRIPHLIEKRKKKFFLEPTGNIYLNFESGDEYDLAMNTKIFSEFIDLPIIPISEYEWSIKFDLSTAGNYHFMNNKINIPFNFAGHPEACGAILSHEIAHAFTFFHKTLLLDPRENEMFTDLITIYLGLGKFILNGIIHIKDFSNHFNLLGYLDPKLISYSFHQFCSDMDCNDKEKISNLNENGLKILNLK